MTINSTAFLLGQTGNRRCRVAGDQPPFAGDLGVRGSNLFEHLSQVLRHGIRHPVVHFASPVRRRRFLDVYNQQFAAAFPRKRSRQFQGRIAGVREVRGEENLALTHDQVSFTGMGFKQPP